MQLDKGQWVMVGDRIGLVADIKFDGTPRYAVHIVNPEDGTTLMELDQKTMRIRDVSVDVNFGAEGIRPATLSEIPEVRRCDVQTAMKLGIDAGNVQGFSSIVLPSGRVKYVPAR